MKVKVKFFASYRDLAGKSEIELNVDQDDSVATVLDKLKEFFPRLSERLGSNMLIALNAEYASITNPVRDGDEIALFPPVSGGSY
jgi:MoaD family protein